MIEPGLRFFSIEDNPVCLVVWRSNAKSGVLMYFAENEPRKLGEDRENHGRRIQAIIQVIFTKLKDRNCPPRR